MASAAFTLQLQNGILPASFRDLEDVDKTEAFSSWTKLSQTEEPLEQLRAIQKLWDGAVASAFQADASQGQTRQQIEHASFQLVLTIQEIG